MQSTTAGSGGATLDGVPMDLDLIVIGTGVAESFVAARFAQAGKRVLQVDTSHIYGGQTQVHTVASLAEITSKTSRNLYPVINIKHVPAPCGVSPCLQSGKLIVDLCPKIYRSRGTCINLLADTGLGRSMDVVAIDNIYVAVDSSENGPASSSGFTIQKVPMTKEDIFASNLFDLPGRRRLMREVTELMEESTSREHTSLSFMEYLAEKKFNQTVSAFFLHGIALFQEDVPTAKGIKSAVTTLRSLGRYSSGAHLLGRHGAGSELAQALCRTCAVFGGTQILGTQIDTLVRTKANTHAAGEEGNTATWVLKIHGANECHNITAPKLVIAQPHAEQLLKRGNCTATIAMAVYLLRRPLETVAVLERNSFTTPSSTLIICSSETNATMLLQQCSDLRICPDEVVLVHARGRNHAEIRKWIGQLQGEESLQNDNFIEAIEYEYKVLSADQREDDSQHLMVVGGTTTEMTFEEDMENLIAQYERFTGDAKLEFEKLADPEK